MPIAYPSLTSSLTSSFYSKSLPGKPVASHCLRPQWNTPHSKHNHKLVDMSQSAHFRSSINHHKYIEGIAFIFHITYHWKYEGKEKEDDIDHNEDKASDFQLPRSTTPFPSLLKHAIEFAHPDHDTKHHNTILSVWKRTYITLRRNRKMTSMANNLHSGLVFLRRLLKSSLHANCQLR